MGQGMKEIKWLRVQFNRWVVGGQENKQTNNGSSIIRGQLEEE